MKLLVPGTGFQPSFQDILKILNVVTIRTGRLCHLRHGSVLKVVEMACEWVNQALVGRSPPPLTQVQGEAGVWDQYWWVTLVEATAPSLGEGEWCAFEEEIETTPFPIRPEGSAAPRSRDLIAGTTREK